MVATNSEPRRQLHHNRHGGPSKSVRAVPRVDVDGNGVYGSGLSWLRERLRCRAQVALPGSNYDCGAIDPQWTVHADKHSLRKLVALVGVGGRRGGGGGARRLRCRLRVFDYAVNGGDY